MTPLSISVVVFCLVGVAAIALYAMIYGSHRALEERLTDLAIKLRVSHGSLEQADMESDSFVRMLFRWAARSMPPPKLDTPKNERLVQSLIQAGYIKSGALQTFRIVRAASAIAGALMALAASFATGWPGANIILFTICGAAIGGFIPSYYLGHKARARQDEIARQISDVLDLLVVCVEAGMGIFEAIKIVGQETGRQKQAIGQELTIVSAEIQAGKSLGQALRALAERTAVSDIKPLAATLIQSEQLGAQMAPALRSISDTLRARRRTRAEEAAQKTTVKMLFPLVLFILPAMIIVIVGPAMIQISHALSH
ncbi:MAG: type II secretion system F family protein [Candidatus Binataceae bacterium]